jgi:hypothetical protein
VPRINSSLAWIKKARSLRLPGKGDRARQGGRMNRLQLVTLILLAVNLAMIGLSAWNLRQNQNVIDTTIHAAQAELAAVRAKCSQGI